MEPKQTRSSKGPEGPIKQAIKDFLEARQWAVIITHGNMWQAGLPDLYIAHQNHGTRWVEVKYAEKYEFTRDQLRVFPLLTSKGVGIWVLALAHHKNTVELEQEYKKLWLPPNWHHYVGHSRRPF